MVAPAYSPFSGRRSARAGTYPPADRRQAGFAGYPDPRGYPFFVPEEEAPTHRKRIAVACGRCRKRKIRCSGDSGNGLPCTNCRNAGQDDCLYLRVASQETRIRSETFVYDIDSSRQYHCRGSASTPSQNLTGDGPSTHETVPYRTSQPPLGYNDRTFETIPTWASTIPMDQMAFNTPYGMPIAIRGSTAPLASVPRDSAGQSESVEVYPTAHAMTSLVHRPAIHDSTPSAAVTGTEDAEDSLRTPSTVGTTSQGHPEATPDAAGPPIAANTSTGVNTEQAVPAPTERHTPAPTPSSNQYLQDSSSTTYARQRGQSPVSSSSGSGPLTPSSETGAASGYPGFDYPALPPTVLPFPMMALSGPLARASSQIYGPSSGSTTSYYSSAPAPTSSGRPNEMTYRYVDTTVSETGEPLVGLLQRHPSPTTEAALALTQHQRGAIYGPHDRPQHTSYVVPSNGGVPLTAEGESADDDCKPAVVHP